MKPVTFVLLLMFSCLIALIAIEKSNSQTAPVPSYALPERGVISSFGPDGISTTYFTDHGRNSTTIGPEGTTVQTFNGNTIMRTTPERSEQCQKAIIKPDDFSWGKNSSE